MGSKQPFEFRASFIELDEGLEVLHTSVERLRQAMGRTVDDRPLMLFETALGEIGSNVLTHGRPPGTEMPVDYVLRFEGGVVMHLNPEQPVAANAPKQAGTQ